MVFTVWLTSQIGYNPDEAPPMRTLFTVSPSEEVTKQMVEDFCKLKIKEATRVEYKRDFPSDLGKHVAAFANSMGGLILLGIETNHQNQPLTPIVGMPFQKGLEERIRQICAHGIHPPLWPAIWVIPWEEASLAPKERCVVVIRTEESDSTPHAVDQRDSIPLRTDNVTNRLRRATVDEIQELFARRRPSVERRTLLISRFRERFAFFTEESLGESFEKIESHRLRTTVADFVRACPSTEILLIPLFPRKPLMNSDGLQTIIHKYPPWRRTPTASFQLLRGSWRPAQEAWVHYSPGTIIQFAELNQYGLFGYCESNSEDGVALERWLGDQSRALERPRIVDPVAFRSALLAMLLSAPKIYEALGFWGSLQLSIRLSRVKGHYLRDAWGQRSPVCPDSEIYWARAFTVAELSESLENIFGDMVFHVHSAFGWADDLRHRRDKEVQQAREITPYLEGN